MARSAVAAESFQGINEAQAAAASTAAYWIIVMESYWRQRVRQKQKQSRAWEGRGKDSLHCRRRSIRFLLSLILSPGWMDGCMDVRCAYWVADVAKDLPLGTVNSHKGDYGYCIGVWGCGDVEWNHKLTT